MARHSIIYVPGRPSTYHNVRRDASGRPVLLIEEGAITKLVLDLAAYLDSGETISAATVSASGPTCTIANTTTTVTLTLSAPNDFGWITVTITLTPSTEKIVETINVRIPNRHDAETAPDYC